MAYKIKGYKYYTKKELDQAFKDIIIKGLEGNNWTDKVAKWYFLCLESRMKEVCENTRLPKRNKTKHSFKTVDLIMGIEYRYGETSNIYGNPIEYGSFEEQTFPYAYNLGIGKIQDFNFLDDANPSLLKHFKYEYKEKDILITAYKTIDESSARICFPCSLFAKPGEYLKKIYDSLKQLCAEKEIEVSLTKKYDNGKYSWWFEYVINVEIV